jgi:uncharacterized protein involved in exopolysaccharide biosynthesis
MATREIAKREPQFEEPDHEPELISGGIEEPREKSRVIGQIGLLWEHRRSLFRGTAIGAVVSIIIALLIPVSYTSTTRLMPPDQSGSGVASMLSVLGKTSGGLGALGGDLLGLKTSGDLFVGVLQSRTVQDDVINKFDLRKVYGHTRYQDTRKTLEHHTEIFADRKSGIITIGISDENPQRAAGMGAEYVEALNRVVATLNTSSAHKERVFLEGRLKEVQQDLESAEKDFSQFASQNTAIDVKEQGKAMIGAAAELEGQLIAAQTELEGLRQIYTAENVRVRSVQARIDEYQRQLQKMGGKPPAAAAAALSGTEATSGQGQDSYPSIRQLPLLGVTWADLFRRTKVEETVLETLTEQYELAKLEEARETPSVKVLDPGEVPERKSFPPRTSLVVFGTLFAFAIGGVWVLARARWEEINPQDPGKVLAHQIFESARTTVIGIANRLSQKSRSDQENLPDR